MFESLRFGVALRLAMAVVAILSLHPHGAHADFAVNGTMTHELRPPNGEVAVDCLVRAVDAAANTCSAIPSP